MYIIVLVFFSFLFAGGCIIIDYKFEKLNERKFREVNEQHQQLIINALKKNSTNNNFKFGRKWKQL